MQKKKEYDNNEGRLKQIDKCEEKNNKPHSHNFFLFQYDVTHALFSYVARSIKIYCPRAVNPVFSIYNFTDV